MSEAVALIDERALSRLRWRCRRGLLENDLLIERFFNRHPDGISETLADENGVSAAHVGMLRTVARLTPEILGRALPINVSGAIPAVMLDAGFPARAMKGLPILARTAGLIAHLLEETERPIGFIMAHHADLAIEYDGPATAAGETHR